MVPFERAAVPALLGLAAALDGDPLVFVWTSVVALAGVLWQRAGEPQVEPAPPAVSAGAPPITVILNARSGTRDVDARRIEAAFAACGLAAIVHPCRGAAIDTLARRAARSDASIIVAAGGDGTVSAVAAALSGTEKTLGVLPCGTLNHFAKDLRLPLDLEGAARVIAGGRSTAVDVGEVNGRVFVNNSSIGFYPHIVRRRALGQRLGRGKWTAFFWAALRVLSRHPFLTVRLRLDSGEEVICRTPFLLIGNNEYALEGLEIGSRARVDGGALGLYMVRGATRLGLLRLAVLALFSRLRDAEELEVRRAREVWVETRRHALHVAADGEVFDMRPPLHYRSRPGALRVLVPRAE